MPTHRGDDPDSHNGRAVLLAGVAGMVSARDQGYQDYKPGVRPPIPYHMSSKEWWDYLRGWMKAKYRVDRGLSD